MATVCLVTGHVPLGDRDQEAYRESGARLRRLQVPLMVFEHQIAQCWAFGYRGRCRLPYGANAQKDTHEYLAVQAQKTEWLRQASTVRQEDILVWVDYGIFHNPDITEEVILQFVSRLEAMDPGVIVSPSCYPPGSREWSPEEPWWFLCGGVLVVPSKLAAWFHVNVQTELWTWMQDGLMTWEVNAWAKVAERFPENFRFYQADHDKTLFTGYTGPVEAKGMRICLNTIMKNEAQNLPRLLKSVAPVVDAVCLHDTGSTDASIEVAMREASSKLLISQGEFRDFSQARNQALRDAREWLAATYPPLERWWLLLLDADHELEVCSGTWKEEVQGFGAFHLTQHDGSLAYDNLRLVRADAVCRYVGTTHEFLGYDGPVGKLSGLRVKDHGDGGSRGDKFERDKRLLEAELQEKPGNPRTLFYLANTCKDSGHLEDAILYYRQRIELGGWHEEVYMAMYYLAQVHLRRCEFPEFVFWCWKAHGFRPSRLESLNLLAGYYREQGENELACAVARLALERGRKSDGGR